MIEMFADLERSKNVIVVFQLNFRQFNFREFQLNFRHFQLNFREFHYCTLFFRKGRSF